MSLYQLVLLTSFGLIEVYVQLRYARAGYPKSQRWKTILFFSSFFIGAGIALLFGLEFPQLGLGRLLVAILFGGLLCGVLFTFIFPEQMKILYPNQAETGNSSQK